MKINMKTKGENANDYPDRFCNSFVCNRHHSRYHVHLRLMTAAGNKKIKEEIRMLVSFGIWLGLGAAAVISFLIAY